MATRSGLSWFGTPTELGRGGMGVVYRATHLATGAEVAIKRLSDEDRTPAALEAFERELRAIAAIDHPHVVELVASGIAVPGDPFPAGSPWLAMELARGTLARHPPATWAEVRDVLRSVLSALATVHAHGILHRDLTPGNVLDTGTLRYPHWRLSDFGLARLAGVGQSGGTPGFRAPERGAAEGPWTDLYGVGCLAWWLLHGASPVEAPWGPRVAAPEGVEAWLDLLLAKSPGERFRHARAAWVALRALGDASALGNAAATPSPASRLTWHDGAAAHEVSVDVPVVADLELPEDWRELAGDDVASVRPWGARAVVAGDAGLGLLAERPPPMIGRDEVCDAVWAALREVAATGASATLRLVGPRGAGHTRLLAWLRELALASGAVAMGDAPDGAAVALRLHDRGEGVGPAPGVAELRVVCDPCPGARDLPLPQISTADAQLLTTVLGGRRSDGVLFWLWSAGQPGGLVRWFDRLTRRDGWWLGSPAGGPIRPDPPADDAELASARARPVEERLAGLAGWPYGSFDGEGAVIDLVSLPDEARRRVLRDVPGPNNLPVARARLWAGDLASGIEWDHTVLLSGGDVFVRDRDERTRALFAAPDPDAPGWTDAERVEVTRACLIARSGSREQLVRWSRRVIADADPYLPVRSSAILVLGGMGLLPEALAEAERVAATAFVHPLVVLPLAAFYPLAWCLMQMRRLDEAEALFARIENDRYALDRGEVARLQGRTEDAERHYQAVGRWDDGPEGALNLALLLVQQRRFAEASRLLQRVRRNPNVRTQPFYRAALRELDALVAVGAGDLAETDRAFDECDALVRANQFADADFRQSALRLADELDLLGHRRRAADVRGRVADWP